MVKLPRTHRALNSQILIEMSSEANKKMKSHVNLLGDVILLKIML